MTPEEIKKYLEALVQDYGDDVLFYEDDDEGFTLHECKVMELAAEIVAALEWKEGCANERAENIRQR